MLDSELLSFKIQAQDDFGVRRVGLEWQGVDDPVASKPAKGERILGAGGQDKEALELAGTFSAKSLGIEPQPVQVRVFVEDYLPGRPRVYSPPYTFYVLNAEQHAIWLTEQLSKWHRQALEVRDRELQLHETNKELRGPGCLRAGPARESPQDREPGRGRAAERPPAGRPDEFGRAAGPQAMRNPEFGVGHLEKWAEMLQILKDISGNRMPSVADLLKEAAAAPASLAQKGNQQPETRSSGTANQEKGLAQASQKPSQPRPMAGQIRASGSGQPADEKPGEQPKDQPVIPRIADMESSQNSPPDKVAENKAAPKKPGPQAPSRLPVTTVMGKPKDAPRPRIPPSRRWTRPCGSSATCSPSSRRSPTS